ncbi:DUF732 domain-containing protein [Rhodococcus tibetensis]|uniref:DUF732 domain-containing protein n=1 Tax=Rhodococcus tibetensis TaxID=2965064 RepID=A0ABT1QHN2_9NOCA|nr:DUF732 domain-containing protein [Rhodococcus sp. FXJ9.536]MCQ4121760.1 DUF732 domain-containing protein [Rhodococcus sp. FXJ9.536]
MRRTLALTALTVCSATILSACGGDSTDSAAPESSSTSAARTTADTAPGKRIFAVADDPATAADYLAYLKSMNQNVTNDETAVHQAGEICTALDAGKPLDRVREEWTPMLTADGVYYYIIGAVTRYCPDHEEILN